MVDRPRIAVALVGVGPTWEQHYRKALARLARKVSILAVCDPVFVRAAAVAEDLGALPTSSPWILSQLSGLHGWLILDPDWYLSYPAELTIPTHLPVLLANTFSTNDPKLAGLFQRSLEAGEAIMPELPQRFTPATIRLRELMATRLGSPQNLRLEVGIEGDLSTWVHDHHSACIEAFDWCAYVTGRVIERVERCRVGTRPGLKLHFSAEANRQGGLTSAVITTNPSVPASVTKATIRCHNGEAELTGPESVRWRTDHDWSLEALEHEQSPWQIILDQFCRRALGGLLPVPTVKEALSALTAARLALQACHDGEIVDSE